MSLSTRRFSTRFLVVATALLLVTVAPAPSQNRTSLAPRLEPVAETRLLMEGLNQPNFNALKKLLTQKPADVDAWTFARGQALLIAENANLLMMRPPKNQGQNSWLDLASDLRLAATRLARSAGVQDYERSRSGLNVLANACNRCHQTFRVASRVTGFAGEVSGRPLNPMDRPIPPADRTTPPEPPPPSLVPKLPGPQPR